MIPDRAKDSKRVIPIKGDVIGRIQDERIGRMMATQAEAHKAGWDTNPEATIGAVRTAHAAGYDAPVSGAMLSAYRVEKGLKQ